MNAFEHPDFLNEMNFMNYIYRDAEKFHKPKGVLITGQEGTGKSTLVAHFLENNPSQKGILAINIPSRTTLRSFIYTLLKKLGEETLDVKSPVEHLMSKIIYLLNEKEIFMIILDDFELVLDENNLMRNQGVLNLLKQIQLDTNVSIFALGLPSCHLIIKQNPQWTRLFPFHLDLDFLSKEKDKKRM
ncbi:ATP-binding protein [Bacillus salipaludis]|uniref:ATP-binding protein n=1 Tax=Bacillus salipaludis TaxID=2547811 RepID=A0A4R5VSN0_9BACI|nr:ATP-binding protein [Bacillus salipaludis]TDK61788.1 ATP-binding protein [Bacillus salipaludis]